MNDTVVLDALPIRNGHEREVLAFARSLRTRPETVEALAEEDITIESVFIDETPGAARLIVCQRLPDVEHAQAALMGSTNLVNVEMRHLMATALDAPVVSPVAFDYAAGDE